MCGLYAADSDDLHGGLYVLQLQSHLLTVCGGDKTQIIWLSSSHLGQAGWAAETWEPALAD